MDREPRYTVLKLSDIKKYLTDDELVSLVNIHIKIQQCRQKSNRPPLETVVVERDWPEYERVWEMLEARCHGIT